MKNDSNWMCTEYGHEWKIEMQTTTCENDGIRTERCQVCHRTRTIKEKALGHDWRAKDRDWTYYKGLSCITHSVVKCECIRCNKLASISTDGKHRYSQELSNGRIDPRCRFCGLPKGFEMNQDFPIIVSYKVDNIIRSQISIDYVYFTLETEVVCFYSNRPYNPFQNNINSDAKKIYDINGTDAVNPIKFNIKITDENGEIIKIIPFSKENIIVNQKIHIHEILCDNYISWGCNRGKKYYITFIDYSI